MNAILKFTGSKFYRAIVAGFFGFILCYVLMHFANLTFSWIQTLRGVEAPENAAKMASNAKLIFGLLGAAIGFPSGFGLLNKFKLGRFFYYSGITAIARGLMGQTISFFAVYWAMADIRTIPQIQQDLASTGEAGLFVAGIVSVFGFLIFSGVTTDWTKWMLGTKTELKHGAPEGEPEWIRYFGIDVNHKVIGIQYGVLGIYVLLVGGLLATLFRLELAMPGMQLFATDDFNTLFSAHGMIMIAAVFLGVGALINYLAPVMLGAADMAFPRMNAFSFWVGVPSATLLMGGLVLGWDTGWTGYPPHSVTTPQMGVILFMLGFYFNGFASIASAINMLVTAVTMRAKGMSIWKMPIFVWTSIATAIMQFSATQTVGVALLMALLQRTMGMEFFDATTNPPGDPVLYQHLFWFYSHPAVYMWVVPGFGLISEILPVFARKPLYGYKWVACSSLGIALVGFIVWAHHMFTSGMPDTLRAVFMVSTMLVGVPTGVKFFSWLGTLWGGKMTYPTPMLFMLGAISVFLLGGLSGPILATVPTDLYLHDTYWVVGHFHATVFGGYIFPFFGAIYFWFPKMTGKMYNESLGKLHFWLILPAFWVMSIGQMVVGMMGMRRRIADYDAYLGGGLISFVHSLITIATLVIGWSVLIMIYNIWSSLRSPVKAPENPWNSRSPEWLAPSPLPEFNYLAPIEILGDPYEYGKDDAEIYARTIPAAGD